MQIVSPSHALGQGNGDPSDTHENAYENVYRQGETPNDSNRFPNDDATVRNRAPLAVADAPADRPDSSRFRSIPFTPWSQLPRVVTQLAYGREVQKVARWAAGVGAAQPHRLAVNLGSKQGAKATGLDRGVVKRALRQMRDGGLLVVVLHSRGNRAHAYYLGELSTARWAPRPGYLPRPRGGESTVGATTESTVGATTESTVGATTESTWTHNPPTGAPTKVESATLYRGVPHQRPAAGRPPSVTAAPLPRVIEGWGSEPPEPTCGCRDFRPAGELGWVALLPCAEHE